jgi:3',5'-cyclic AMP phosphodiesterase CpdA/orotate phosphoribosyltransferase-like protein
MKKAIIHISDLHITEHKNDDGDILSTSWFTTHEIPFLKSIVQLIRTEKRKLGIEIFYLIVSGDLSNTSTIEEYKNTAKFLEKVIKELEIIKENIIIIPGNHDINWYENKKAVEEYKLTPGPLKKAREFNSQKFKNFKNFFDEFFHEKSLLFQPDKVIVHTVPLHELKIVLIGLNSVLMSSHTETQLGDIDNEKLDEELQDLQNIYGEYEKICIFHHNPKFSSLNGKSTLKNWSDKVSIFESFNIKTFIFGHEHTYGSTKDDKDFCNYIATGSLGINKKDINNYINIIEIIESDSDIKLKTNFFKLEKEGKLEHPEFGFWNFLNDSANSKELMIVEKPKHISSTTSNSLLPKVIESVTEEETTTESTVDTKESVVELDYSDFLVDYIKKNKAFKSGHFHWTENAKSHNWLDISTLLKSREMVLMCQKAIFEIIKKYILKTDLIIGIGMEGSFLGSSISLLMNSHFTFLPYEYRYKDHEEYEKKLNLRPNANITIIIDVVHSGSTIKSLLESHKDFFKESESINLISLFYTGKKEYSIDLFKEEIDKRLTFYNVCSKIKVEACPYGSDYKEKCTVYSKKLDTIYEFYNNGRNK